MALVSDGSRICDANRNALAAIDQNYVLTQWRRNREIIYAGGVFCNTVGFELMLSTIWNWRREGGAFAAFTATSELSFGASTVLVDFSDVTNANKRTNQTATSVDGILSEWEGTTGGTEGSTFLETQSGETQIAVSFKNAVPGIAYEFRLTVNLNPSGSYVLDYPAKVVIPIDPPDLTRFPKPKLRR